jgi:hypothetical protein
MLFRQVQDRTLEFQVNLYVQFQHFELILQSSYFMLGFLIFMRTHKIEIFLNCMSVHHHLKKFARTDILILFNSSYPSTPEPQRLPL